MQYPVILNFKKIALAKQFGQRSHSLRPAKDSQVWKKDKRDIARRQWK